MATRSTKARSARRTSVSALFMWRRKDRGDLEVDQFGSGKVLAAQAGTRGPFVRAVVGQRDHQNTGVNDEHGLRAAVAAEAKRIEPPERPAARSRTDSPPIRPPRAMNRHGHELCGGRP